MKAQEEALAFSILQAHNLSLTDGLVLLQHPLLLMVVPGTLLLVTFLPLLQLLAVQVNLFNWTQPPLVTVSLLVE
jgi:hypothetical protein